ncbi:MAG: hypothetical protein KF901_15560 [Myxococcales bacterium]|nr:hypothetical protein [Myxococcales bacterium]
MRVVPAGLQLEEHRTPDGLLVVVRDDAIYGRMRTAAYVFLTIALVATVLTRVIALGLIIGSLGGLILLLSRVRRGRVTFTRETVHLREYGYARTVRLDELEAFRGGAIPVPRLSSFSVVATKRDGSVVPTMIPLGDEERAAQVAAALNAALEEVRAKGYRDVPVG